VNPLHGTSYLNWKTTDIEYIESKRREEMKRRESLSYQEAIKIIAHDNKHNLTPDEFKKPTQPFRINPTPEKKKLKSISKSSSSSSGETEEEKMKRKTQLISSQHKKLEKDLKIRKGLPTSLNIKAKKLQESKYTPEQPFKLSQPKPRIRDVRDPPKQEKQSESRKLKDAESSARKNPDAPRKTRSQSLDKNKE